MSVIATTMLDNDEDLLMSRRLWDDLQKKGFEGIGEKSDEDDSSSDDESSAEEKKHANDSELSSEEEDE